MYHTDSYKPHYYIINGMIPDEMIWKAQEQHASPSLRLFWVTWRSRIGMAWATSRLVTSKEKKQQNEIGNFRFAPCTHSYTVRPSQSHTWMQNDAFWLRDCTTVKISTAFYSIPTTQINWVVQLLQSGYDCGPFTAMVCCNGYGCPCVSGWLLSQSFWDL